MENEKKGESPARSVRVNKNKRSRILEDSPSPPTTIPMPAKRDKVVNDSSSEDEETSSVRDDVVTSVYQAAPIRGIFSDNENLNSYIDDMVTELNAQRPDLSVPILRYASEIKALRVKLHKIPKKVTHYTQFSYKTPLRLAVVTNMFVNTMDNFNERKKILDMAHLEPKHRLSILVSSVEYWWHEKSKQLMRAFFEDKLVHDLKSVSTKDAFTEAVNKFHINDPVKAWLNIKEKILTAKRVNNSNNVSGMTPGVWNIKIQNTQTIPSKVSVHLMEFKNDSLKCSLGKWKHLILEPKYIHAFAVITISGFKITRSGMSLDAELDFLAYSNVPLELQQ